MPWTNTGSLTLSSRTKKCTLFSEATHKMGVTFKKEMHHIAKRGAAWQLKNSNGADTAFCFNGNKACVLRKSDAFRIGRTYIAFPLVSLTRQCALTQGDGFRSHSHRIPDIATLKTPDESSNNVHQVSYETINQQRFAWSEMCCIELIGTVKHIRNKDRLNQNVWYCRTRFNSGWPQIEHWRQ